MDGGTMHEEIIEWTHFGINNHDEALAITCTGSVLVLKKHYFLA